MRTALTSLILAAGLTGAAQAQTPAAAPAAPAQSAPSTAAPAAAAPATGAPMTSPPATAAPTTAAPAAPVTSPAAPPPAAAAEPPPVLPTTGDGAAVVQALEKVCIPAVRGQGLDAAAKAAGLKANRRDGTWTMPLGGAKDYAIIFQPQFSQKDVCQAEVRFAVGQDRPIVTALNIWAFLQEPKLVLQANYVNVDPDGVKRVRKSWEHFTAGGPSRAVNFSIQRKPDDTPLNPRYDSGMLFYQERATAQ